jgi:hypothetical protein
LGWVRWWLGGWKKHMATPKKACCRHINKLLKRATSRQTFIDSNVFVVKQLIFNRIWACFKDISISLSFRRLWTLKLRKIFTSLSFFVEEKFLVFWNLIKLIVVKDV